MAKIIGNTTATAAPCPDWNQTDSLKADYIKNKPVLNATSLDDIAELGIYKVDNNLYISSLKGNKWNTDLTVPFYFTGTADVFDTISFSNDKSSITNGDTLLGIPLLKYDNDLENNGYTYIFLSSDCDSLIIYYNNNGVPIQDTIYSPIGLFSGKIDLSSVMTTYSVYSVGNDICGNWALINQYFVAAKFKAEKLVAETEMQNLQHQIDENSNTTNNIVANALKGNKSGEAVGLFDVSPIEHELKVNVSSKNLLPYPYFRQGDYEIAGVYFTDNGDGSITANGSAERQSYFMLFRGVLPLGKYCITGVPTGVANGITIYVANKSYSLWVEDKGNGATFNVTAEEQIDIVLNIVAGTTADNITIYPQLELGTTPTNYAPYIADISKVNVKRQGKNLIPYPYYETTKTINEVTFTDNGNGSITVNGTAPADAALTTFYFTESTVDISDLFVDGGTYVINDITLPTGNTINMVLDVIDKSTNNATYIYRGQSFTVDKSKYLYKGFRIQMGKDWSADNVVVYPQIELGTTPTEYEPYTPPITASVNASGTVRGLKSIYPTTTLTTDTKGAVVDVEYNRDINKAFAELQQVIISLGGNV